MDETWTIHAGQLASSLAALCRASAALLDPSVSMSVHGTLPKSHFYELIL